MSTQIIRRRLPSDWCIDHIIHDDGEEAWFFSIPGRMRYNITKAEYDALYPLSKEVEG